MMYSIAHVGHAKDASSCLHIIGYKPTLVHGVDGRIDTHTINTIWPSTATCYSWASDEDDDSLGAEKGHLSTAMAGWLDSRDDLRQPARGRPAAAAAAGRQRASYGRLATITSETVLDSSPGPAPSAPPLEADGGGEGAAFLPGRDRTESDPPGHHHPLADGGYGRSVSVPANAVIHGGVAHHTCPSCSSIIAPPPAYDDDDAGRPPPPAYEAPDTAVPLRPPI